MPCHHGRPARIFPVRPVPAEELHPPWFAFLDRHHYIHHVALGTNLNFLLPLADLLFGTLRRQLTPEELAQHGPLERAKARPAGQGERARAAAA